MSPIRLSQGLAPPLCASSGKGMAGPGTAAHTEWPSKACLGFLPSPTPAQRRAEAACPQHHTTALPRASTLLGVSTPPAAPLSALPEDPPRCQGGRSAPGGFLPAAAENSECFHLETSAHVNVVVGWTTDRDGCDFSAGLHGPAAEGNEHLAGFGGTLAGGMHLAGWTAGPTVARVSGSSGKAVSSLCGRLSSWRVRPKLCGRRSQRRGFSCLGGKSAQLHRGNKRALGEEVEDAA